jgi:hypothetical protein
LCEYYGSQTLKLRITGLQVRALPGANQVLELVYKPKTHAEHRYYKGPVFIKLAHDMMQKLHYAPPAYIKQHAQLTMEWRRELLAAPAAEAGTRIGLDALLGTLQLPVWSWLFVLKESPHVSWQSYRQAISAAGKIWARTKNN